MNTDVSDGQPRPTTRQQKVPVRFIVRKGQRKPYGKATRKQIEQRIESAARRIYQHVWQQSASGVFGAIAA